MRAPARPIAADLFGEIPVSARDVESWLDHLPQLSASAWRRAAYARSYNVVEKIRAAKAAGTWPPSDCGD
jgi:hypothetical protein